MLWYVIAQFIFYTGAFELAPSAIKLLTEIIQISYKTGRTFKKTDCVFDFDSVLGIIDDVIFCWSIWTLTRSWEIFIEKISTT
jgi:hypothetical protein